MALLAIDVGNTQTVFGLFDGTSCVSTGASRPSGAAAATSSARSTATSSISRASRGSRSPRPCRSLHRAYEELAKDYARAELLELGPGVKTGVPIRYEDPREVGPDRIANAVAAVERYGSPCIVVDFGTSTNFDVVSAEGEYVGGVLAPGIEVSMDALFQRAARLFKVDFVEPPTVIAKNTAASLQSGLVYGFAGQVDGIVERIRGELGEEAQTVATGGLADLIVPHARTLDRVDPFLTLEGLRLVWERNRES